MPRKLPDQDLDFNIFVDPSCLSEPMEDETTTTTSPDNAQPLAMSPITDAILSDPVPVKDGTSATMENIDIPEELNTEAEDVVAEKEEEIVSPPEEAEAYSFLDSQQEDSIADPISEVQHNEEEPQNTSVLDGDGSHISAQEQQDDSTAEVASPSDVEFREEELPQPDTEVEEDHVASFVEDVSMIESEAAFEQQEVQDHKDVTNEDADDNADDKTVAPQAEEPDLPTTGDHSQLDGECDEELPQESPSVALQDMPDTHPTEAADNKTEAKAEAEAEQPEEQEHGVDDSFQEDDPTVEDAETPRATYHLDTEGDVERPCPPSAYSDRKTSLRTEALIQAAARAVVASIEKRHASGDSIHPEEEEDEEAEPSFISTGTQETNSASETQSTYDGRESDSRRQSSDSIGSQLHHTLVSAPASGDEGGESSSQHEGESDDVFSDRSARSSIASFDAANDTTLKSPMVQDHIDNESVRSHTRSPRMSGVSLISDLSQYDKEDFIPTSRDTRIPFRTPSAIRNIQMSSPTPSVFNGGSPRSSKRQAGNSTGGGMLPTISRLGSPNVTTQFSPKGRSTPTRFKSRKEAPLVLLHVTLLPLRWMWGDVLNGLDAVNGKTYGESQQPLEVSDQLKTLRDSWRELQDRVGDTVLERGILLPHPQNDYEVLEERLLEALELPLRRRARILECGHYLGPSNEFGEDECSESEDECASQLGEAREAKRHWCNTCRGEIRYEDLGPGKVFRVQVYASNGLMRAGAWQACWKEMERVDVEVEPIVEPSVQNELELLATVQVELEEQRQREEEERQREEERHQREAEREVEADQEEPQLPTLDQNRRRSTAVAAPEEEELSTVEEQILPIVSDQDRPYTEHQRQQAAMTSSPSPTSMQMTMHASPLQPPTTISAMRFASPSPTPRSLLPPEPIDMSEERRRRDEERLREIYGEPTAAAVTTHATPLPIEAAPEPTSSMHAQSTTQPRHPDSYIPPPSPRSPSEEAYERRMRAESRGGDRDQRRHHQSNLNLEDASFMDLLLEAFKVLLRDPKNVAIIVLCLFVAAILIRPAQPPQMGLEVHRGGRDQAMEAYGRHDGKAMQEVFGDTQVVQQPVVTVRVETTSSVEEAVVFVATSVAEVLEVETVVAALLEVATEVPAPVVDKLEMLEVDEPEVAGEILTSGEEAIADASDEEATEEVSEPEELKPDPTDLPAAEDSVGGADEDSISDETAGTEDHDTAEPLPLVDEMPIPATEKKVLPVDEAPGETSPSEADIEAPAPAPVQSEDMIDVLPEEQQATEEDEVETSAVDPCTPLVQKTTLRVYETVTETVTISAATATAEETDTATPITETAIPQTVEETVYETETVRVTVSVVADGATPSARHDEL